MTHGISSPYYFNTIVWNGIKLIRISSIGKEFREWLYGQTCPVVDEDETPFDWAYYHDYERYINNLPVID